MLVLESYATCSMWKLDFLAMSCLDMYTVRQVLAAWISTREFTVATLHPED